MCIVCVSSLGIPQPTENQIAEMFKRNPDGAGYMVARNGKVEIHKGFMTFNEFMSQIRREKFTSNDVVVYHFRISTQGGINREMCHPFGLTRNIKETKALDLIANVGIAHNGIIPLTTNHRDYEYSDTAHFIAEYMSYFIRKPEEINDPQILNIIDVLGNSKFALMNGRGDVQTVGSWITEDNGLMFSNITYKPVKTYYKPKATLSHKEWTSMKALYGLE